MLNVETQSKAYLLLYNLRVTRAAMVKSINWLLLIVFAACLSFAMCCAIQSQVVIVSAAYLIFYVWELDEVIQLKHETEQMIQEVDEMLRVD